MSRVVRDWFVLPLCIIGVMILLGGCGSGGLPSRPEPVPVLSQLWAITRAYTDAIGGNERPPANKEELLPYLKSYKDRQQPGTEADLRSERDGQEFVIHWGVDLRQEDLHGDPAKMLVLAYEKTGKDGKRFVSQIRDVREVTDEELRQLPFPEGYKFP
jgi:hypothetical protein